MMNRSALKKGRLLLISFKFCLVFLFVFCHAKAQQAANSLPTVIPPSPAIANFNRYGEIPIDFSTGVPSISVPIYTVKSRQLELPISISYHASGIKVQDKASVIGLGWVLNAGGSIGVTQMGHGGEDPFTYSHLTYHNSAEFEAARAAANASQPSAPMDNGLQSTPLWNLGFTIEHDKQAVNNQWKSDRYTFNLPNGQSGIFRYDYATGELFVLPYSNTKITSSGTAPNTNYTVVDDKGITYIFKKALNNNPSILNASAWDLMSMISADKTDTIRFVYKLEPNIYVNRTFSSYIECGAYMQYDTFVGNAWASYNDYHYSPFNISSISSSVENVLDSIVTSTTVVKFTTAGDRQDLGTTVPYRLSGISIYSKITGDLIKSCTFNNNAYFGTAGQFNQRLKLAGMSFSGSDQVSVQNYSFVYDEDFQMIPYTENFIGRGTPTFREDYWGYDNGNAGYSLVPLQFVPNPVVDGQWGPPATLQMGNAMDRSPNPTYAQINLLQEIHYPTGGKTVFTFEPNRSGIPSPLTAGNIVGGFRIQSIKNYADPMTLTDYKSYVYGPGFTRDITADLYSTTFRAMKGGNTGYYTILHTINSSSYLPLTIDNGPPVFYNYITEFNGDRSGNVGKTVYEYETPPSMPAPKFDTPFDQIFYRDADEMEYGNYVPHLSRKTVYKNAGATYFPVNRVENTYTDYLSDRQYFTGIHPALSTLYDGGQWQYDYVWCTHLVNGATFCSDASVTLGYPNYYYWTDLHATQQSRLVTQSKTYDFNPGDSTKFTAAITSYSYGNAVTGSSVVHLEPTQKTTTSSTGDTFITNLQYPSDFSSTAPYGSMITRNILTPVIQQLNYKNVADNAHFLRSTKTDYQVWNSNANQIYPSLVSTQKGAAGYEPRIQYYGYDDQGNTKTVGKSGGPKINYIWGYGGDYPIAQITNADYSAIESLLGGSLAIQNFRNIVSPSDADVKNFLAPLRVSGNLPAALVTTYTYKPLVGMTSTTDAKGMTTYYEYDSFQRLMNVKDQDGNILKHTDYHYQNQ